jgi:hypothetical protein
MGTTGGTWCRIWDNAPTALKLGGADGGSGEERLLCGVDCPPDVAAEPSRMSTVKTGTFDV